MLPSVNESDAGVQRPFLLRGYNSDPEAPLVIYRCRDHCPGGSPGTCSDGRSGVTCAVCPRGTFGSLQGRCAKCVEGNQAFWLIGGAILLLAGLFPAYVLLTAPYSPKSRVSGVTIAVLGLLVTLVQNLLVIRTAPTTWPGMMLVMTNVLYGITLDPQLVGVACVGLDVVTMYFLRVLVFPAMIGILLLTFALTQLWPNLCQCAVRGLLACYRPLARILRTPMPSITMAYGPWTWYGTACVIGKFCQMTFPTMANVGLSPMMCYSHPGGQMWSVVNYSNTACGTSEHVWMLIVGGVLLTFTTAFLVLCIWAGRSAPRLSLQGQAALKFLFEEFRPDMVWFGVITLMRGACLSLPSVFAPNRPNVQLVMMHSVMLISLVFQANCQPWKSPALNLVDTIVQCLFLTLLGVGLGGLEQSEEAVDVLHGLGTVVCICLSVVFGLVLSTLSVALLFEKVFRSEALGRYCNTLGEAPTSALIVFLLQNLANSIQKYASHRSSIASAVEQLGTYDARMILMALMILETEIGLSTTEGFSLPRINATLTPEASEPSRVSAGLSTAVAKRRIAKRLSQVECKNWMRSQESLKSEESQQSKDSINFAVSEEPDQSDHADVDRESDMVKTYV